VAIASLRRREPAAVEVVREGFLVKKDDLDTDGHRVLRRYGPLLLYGHRQQGQLTV